MTFIQFKPENKGVNTKDSYTIQAGTKSTGYFSGMIYFNGGMRDKLSLCDYSHVELFTDKESKRIAVRFTNTKTEATRALRHNGSALFVTCSSWLYVATKDLGYPEKGNGSYKLIETGLVVLELPEPEEQS